MPEPEQIVQIPFEPRWPQRAALEAMRKKRYGVLVAHRRLGKSVLAVNMLQQGALMCTKERPRFAYVGVTYRQGKATVWDFCKHFSKPIPGLKINESELRIDYPNGGQVRLYGGDDPDALRGLYFDGIFVDEYGLHQADIFSTVLRPAIADRGGWAMFGGTPNGKNQFYDILKHAQQDEDWYWGIYKASETGILGPHELAAARKVMTQDEYDQEFECSFEASVKGAIYAKELADARAEKRVGRVPVDPILPVDTYFDLGMKDATAIWFAQSLRGGEIRVVDYYEASGEGLPHYAKVLKDKGYNYGTHWAPHDAKVREMGSGRSRIEAARSLGLKFQIVPNIPLEDGIHAVRMILSRCWFDARKCDAGLEALGSYRRDYNSRISEFKSTPVHDWASNGADAFRYLAVSIHEPRMQQQRARTMLPSGSEGWMG